MCHLIFLLPVAGLPLFWLLPLGYALPINAALWALSALLFWVVSRTMRMPVHDSFNSLIGTRARVVSRKSQGSICRYLVRSHDAGELWSAYSTDTLQAGELVGIVAVRGIGVVVRRLETEDVMEAR